MKRKQVRYIQIISFVVLFFSMSFGARSIYQMKFNNVSRKYLKRIHQRTKIVCLGSSIFQYGINDKPYRSILNLGQIGERSYIHYLKLKLIEDSFSKNEKKILLLDASPFMLRFRNDGGERYTQILTRYQPLTNKLSVKEELDYLENLPFEKKCLYLYRKALPYTGHGFEYKHHWMGGFKNLKKRTKSFDKAQAIELINTKFWSSDTEFSPFLKKYFEKTIAFAKENDIQVILVESPYRKLYNENMKENYRNQYKDYLNSVSEKLQVPYWDMSELPLEDSMFNDLIHLNGEGASVFTKAIIKRLKEEKYL